ncbi:aminotransferase class V-fold PLP-dependent enzyme [Neoehrlichia mikurensis]|uniref:Aminotransferase class V-fold PLP-dependent enzyme n=1 Tax=Neoehrlichia mikurensis TaxID=89586 RepID=A0A9Q9BZS6_9RICK|nr:aminotransferase class V-fold PLP-dependent enzyme [Neoehrlichia mikurensis]QXK91912.1 aminotransferase class V-fold PLP-dependent enzyme [Neoehrlichia mikurensis]QXK93125.1 aminotransferase class V-fold PLP-dependent enzyme [Neoehrlichia mikurensis]QXK93605.1 aminotransferase class V-fold PLP-dependent enzyme [Neoehrlichia mikurensis]UTO55440.1 aminotransferase class V-fold PLP-dependent enzyme [Neoehrlichia mikurensis]UTO56360.1 aminotransferase class V-fold PLP-dependent enzyme [Neoehrli
MLITTRFRYAVMFISNLAHTDQKKHKTLNIIQDLSLSKGYLEQVITKLKKTGLIRATKGPGGKYSLNIAPNLITLNLILDAIGERVKITRCEGGESSKSCLVDHSQKCNTHNFWSNMECYIRNYLSHISIKDILSNKFRFDTNNNYIYADYNATSSINPTIKQQLSNMLLFDNIYNPSSMHKLGQKTRKIIEDTREIISKKLNTKKHDIIFTSSGTEANNLVFSSTKDYHHIISATEHLSVINSAIAPIIIPVDQDGIISLNELVNVLQSLKNEKILVSVMLANNETGVIQPIKEITEISHKFGAVVHTDAVQACGKIHIDVSDLGVDVLTISSHKIGGLSGAGALLFNNSVINIQPTILGGSQEKGLRAGTENVAAIYSLLLSLNNLDNYIQKMNYIKNLRNQLEHDIMHLVPSCKIFGKNADRLPNTTCIAMPGVSNEVQLIKFDQNNIAIGIGSACSSGKANISHVLSAMNVSEQFLRNTIRISLGVDTEEQHVKKIVDCWYEIYQQSQKIH